MGYFEALASSSFKTAADGSRLFFPSGRRGRGYVIASERDYQRLRRQIKTYLVSLFGAFVLLRHFIGTGNTYVALAVIAVPLMGF